MTDYRIMLPLSRSSSAITSRSSSSFPDKWQIDLIADHLNIRDQARGFAYLSFEQNKFVVKTTWNDFLLSAVRANEQIMEIYAQTHANEDFG